MDGMRVSPNGSSMEFTLEGTWDLSTQNSAIHGTSESRNRGKTGMGFMSVMKKHTSSWISS